MENLNPLLYNAAVQKFAQELVQQLKQQIRSLNIQHQTYSTSNKPMINIVGARTRQQQGTVNRISISMPRHAIFVHVGAGKGRGGAKGSTWVNNKGERKTTNPNSIGKMNTGNRTAKEWYNPIIDRELPKLQAIVGKQYGTMVINALKIKHQN